MSVQQPLGPKLQVMSRVISSKAMQAGRAAAHTRENTAISISGDLCLELEKKMDSICIAVFLLIHY